MKDRSSEILKILLLSCTILATISCRDTNVSASKCITVVKGLQTLKGASIKLYTDSEISSDNAYDTILKTDIGGTACIEVPFECYLTTHVTYFDSISNRVLINHETLYFKGGTHTNDTIQLWI